jgi:hypothetical protein
MNPLGVRAMYLGASTYRIHGTDAPWTIGQAVSKGCIRMFNEDVLDLYPRVPVGTKVTVTWQRFSSQAVASSDEPAPFDPMASAPAYKSPPRSIRQRTPSAAAEMAAGSYGEAAPAVDTNADDQTLAAAAEKPIEPKPVKKAEAHKKHEATPASHDAVAIAEKAAAAAAKAAEAARAAAEAAKKAAEDAKNATSVQSSEPDKRAAL